MFLGCQDLQNQLEVEGFHQKRHFEENQLVVNLQVLLQGYATAIDQFVSKPFQLTWVCGHKVLHDRSMHFTTLHVQ